MTAAAIFVKTPGLSPLKTRLAADIGQQAAERWYLRAANAVAEIAAAADLAAVYWAVAEPEALDHPTWANLPCLEQGTGSLGMRMARVHNGMVERHGSALLLGADAPQLDPDWLSEASRWLKHSTPRLCLGPAHDGGFWTFGANRVIPESHWCSISYSRSDTRVAFEREMGQFGAWKLLPVVTDVDRAADLDPMAAELANLPGLLPGQRRLL